MKDKDQEEALSYDQFVMAEQVLCLMTDHWILNLKLLLRGAVVAKRTRALRHGMRGPRFESCRPLFSYLHLFSEDQSTYLEKIIAKILKYRGSVGREVKGDVDGRRTETDSFVCQF